jgi:hypothetical protein
VNSSVIHPREGLAQASGLKSLSLEPDPSTLPGDRAEVSFLARMIVGPADAPGEESFDVTV